MTVNDFVIERIVKKEIEYLSLARQKSSETPFEEDRFYLTTALKKIRLCMYVSL